MKRNQPLSASPGASKTQREEVAGNGSAPTAGRREARKEDPRNPNVQKRKRPVPIAREELFMAIIGPVSNTAAAKPARIDRCRRASVGASARKRSKSGSSPRCPGQNKRESAEARAERIIPEELQRFGLMRGEAFVVRRAAPLSLSRFLRLAANRASNTINHMLHRPAPWPHAPTHQLSRAGTYFVTAGTYRKVHHFGTSERLDVLQRGLLKLAAEYRWHLEAWAVFSNHYHFVAHSPEQDAKNLSAMLSMLHQKTAMWVNKRDATPGRQVWFNFRESRLTYQKSYFTRLSYVHQNAVKHGLVPLANQYRWCSAAWFERSATPAQVKCIYRFKTDDARVFDEFEPVGDPV